MSGIQSTVSRALSVLVLAVGVALPARAAETDARPVTFTRDIAPILQRSCQGCHRPDSIAPMSLLTYGQVRPFARAIRQQTALRQMPPWYIEKNIGIQKFLADPALSDAEIAMIGRWVDAGAPEGNPADMPAPKKFGDPREWALGTPDLIVSSAEVNVDATQPDWWGQLGAVPTGLTEDRYIASSEIREVNDIPPGKSSTRTTVGGLNVFHHASVTLIPPPGVAPDPSSSLPAHEVGRNGDLFDPDAGRMLKAGSSISFNNNHLHANGRKTKGHLEIGLRFHPKGYTPKIDFRGIFFGTTEFDLPGNTANQRIEAYYTLPENSRLMNFEPHMHATATRMCLEAIYGATMQTLSCAGYNHSWVRNYQYAPDAAPLLPKGTILRAVGWFDTTPANPRLIDYRNWTGGGNRSVDNMFISLSHISVLSDEQFKAEVAKREQQIRDGKAEPVGCITCGVGTTMLAGQRASGNR
jgi:hypothetical protein